MRNFYLKSIAAQGGNGTKSIYAANEWLPCNEPYPKPNGMLKQPGGIQSFMNSLNHKMGQWM